MSSQPIFRATWVGATLAVLGLVCLAAAREASSPAPSRSPAAATKDPAAVKRERMIRTFARRLARLKPVGATKKGPDDFYLLGTAELDPARGHADVCFQVKQGQQQVAEFLVDYMLEAPKNVARKWHVFCRLKDARQAQQALQFARMQYDQLASYRDDLKKRYKAKTIRRC